MRSVYTKIVAWCFSALILSLIAIVAVSVAVSSRAMRGQSMMQKSQLFRLDQAIRAYEQGGPKQLGANLAGSSRFFPDEAHLTDSQGRDLVTGEDRSPLLQGADSVFPRKVGDHVVAVVSDRSRRYRLLVLLNPPEFDFLSILPYYVPILIVLAGLCLLLASDLALPLKKLLVAVDRFGRGDLEARADLSRSDEIGDLARAFNLMAERITTLLNAERRLLQDISHEIRSPLARLSFGVELARTAEDRDAAAARLRKEIERLSGLVNGLLQATRAEGECALSDVSMDALVAEIVEDCHLEASAKGCELTLLSRYRDSLSMDPELMRRAIENVVRNAIRFSPEGSLIEIGIEQQRNQLLVSVRDQGPGVPPEMLERIFLPFFRADASRNTAAGVGLGLSIAQRAVQLHGGQILARNMQPGLEVSIAIPLSPAAHSAVAATHDVSRHLPIA